MHNLIAAYNSLDSQITECLLSAEHTCTKDTQEYAWSLKLVKASKVVQYWKTRKLSILNNIDFDHLFHLARVLEIEDDPSLTFDEIQSKLTAARKQPKEVQKNAAAL
eukprot:5076735-Ditylum_brightwellii.AAC.2